MKNRSLARARVLAEQVDQKAVQCGEPHHQGAKPQEESKRTVLQSRRGVVVDDVLPNMEVALLLKERYVWQRGGRWRTVNNLGRLNLPVTHNDAGFVFGPTKLLVGFLDLLLQQFIVPTF